MLSIACYACSREKPVVVNVQLLPGCNQPANLEVLNKRLQALHKKNTVELLNDNQIRVSLYNAADTACLQEILTSRGEVYIIETVSNIDIFPMLQQANKILRKDDINTANSNEYEDDSQPLFTLLYPYEYNGQLVPGSQVGFALARDTLEVNRLLNSSDIKTLFPNPITFMWTAAPQGGRFGLIAISTHGGRFELNPTTVEKAEMTYSKFNSRPEVSLEFKTEYHDKWAQLTRNSIGRDLAIVSDGKVLSFPRVQSEITGGKAAIAGNYTEDFIQTLAAIIMGGVLDCIEK